MSDTEIHNSQSGRDRAYSFHPYTNLKVHAERGPDIIERGEGIFVYDDTGREYIEGLAGLWSVAVGYGRKRLVDVAAEQMLKLPYYHSFSHKANNPSINLAEKLVSMSPTQLTRVFFANSGSEANDSIIKFVWYYNNAVGRPEKKKFISRQRAYHGITVASGSLTGLPWNHKLFDLPIDNILHVSCPHHYRFAEDGETEEEFATRLADELEETIQREGPETVAAFIGEPIMGAGGVLVPPRTYWEKIQQVCRRHDVLIIADEVINGFGRTGTLFASDHYGIEPDILVLSKQITSSYLPLSAVLLTEKLYQGIAEGSNEVGMFGHGFTTSGHPVATAVGLENIKIIEEERLVENAARVGETMQAKLREFTDHPLVGEVRGVGLIGAVELVADKKTKAHFDPHGKVGSFFFEQGHKNGVIIRNVQDSFCVCPPLVITDDQAVELVARLGRTLDDTLDFATREMNFNAN